MSPLNTYFHWAGVVWTVVLGGLIAAVVIEVIRQKRQERHGSHIPGLVVVPGDSSPDIPPGPRWSAREPRVKGAPQVTAPKATSLSPYDEDGA